MSDDNKNINKISLPVDLLFISNFFDRDERTIQLWVQKGMPREQRGNYDLVACTRWLIRELRQENEELKSGDQTLSRLRKVEQEMRNEEREIKLKKLRGEYIEVELVKSTWVTMGKVIVKFLEGLAVKINRRVNGDSITLAAIHEEINLIREDISKLKPGYFTDIEDEDDSGSETEDNELNF
ncbi:MAG: hypothetical protein LCH52_05525 [Bacteroidetes bacterium]|nr:hypothetical protein [Bacteroidota bacterium]